MKGEVIRRAEESDLDAIVALVTEAGLPAEGVRERLAEFFVAERDARVMGCSGLEVYGADALLRSVAVAEDERGSGTGARLVERALAEARDRRLASVSLLTTTASSFFPRFGFREVERDTVPALVRESDEFRSICPSTATCMFLALVGEGDVTEGPGTSRCVAGQEGR